MFFLHTSTGLLVKLKHRVTCSTWHIHVHMLALNIAWWALHSTRFGVHGHMFGITYHMRGAPHGANAGSVCYSRGWQRFRARCDSHIQSPVLQAGLHSQSPVARPSQSCHITLLCRNCDGMMCGVPRLLPHALPIVIPIRVLMRVLCDSMQSPYPCSPQWFMFPMACATLTQPVSVSMPS